MTLHRLPGAFARWLRSRRHPASPEPPLVARDGPLPAADTPRRALVQHVDTGAKPWRTVACSVAGTSHVESGRPCDDVSVVVEIGRTVLLAVADGAGSARHSRKGATVAVAASVDAATRRLGVGEAPADRAEWRLLLAECLRRARSAIDACEEPRGELACTLLLAIVHEGTLATVAVGDGWVVAEDLSGETRAVLRPSKGEYFNETFFVSSDTFLSRAAFGVEPADDLAAIAVLSDGLDMVACDLTAMQPVHGFFGPLFAFVREAPLSTKAIRSQLVEFLRSDRINRRTDDDKSLAIAVRWHGSGGSRGSLQAREGRAAPA